MRLRFAGQTQSWLCFLKTHMFTKHTGGSDISQEVEGLHESFPCKVFSVHLSTSDTMPFTYIYASVTACLGPVSSHSRF